MGGKNLPFYGGGYLSTCSLTFSEDRALVVMLSTIKLAILSAVEGAFCIDFTTRVRVQNCHDATLVILSKGLRPGV